MTAARVVWGGLRFHVKTLTLSNFFLLTTFLLPAIFASIAFFLVEAGGRPGTLLYAALGAGMMGVWSSTLFGSGGAIQWQRYQGTLELLVATPSPFLLVLLPITLASATVGTYSLGDDAPVRVASSSACRSTSRIRSPSSWPSPRW